MVIYKVKLAVIWLFSVFWLKRDHPDCVSVFVSLCRSQFYPPPCSVTVPPGWGRPGQESHRNKDWMWVMDTMQSQCQAFYFDVCLGWAMLRYIEMTDCFMLWSTVCQDVGRIAPPCTVSFTCEVMWLSQEESAIQSDEVPPQTETNESRRAEWDGGQVACGPRAQMFHWFPLRPSGSIEMKGERHKPPPPGRLSSVPHTEGKAQLIVLSEEQWSSFYSLELLPKQNVCVNGSV